MYFLNFEWRSDLAGWVVCKSWVVEIENGKMKQLDVEMSTPANDSQTLAETGSKTT